MENAMYTYSKKAERKGDKMFNAKTLQTKYLNRIGYLTNNPMIKMAVYSELQRRKLVNRDQAAVLSFGSVINLQIAKIEGGK